MTFADKFREKYRVALYAARANNQDATLAGLADLYRLFAEQYALDNGDSIVVKAKSHCRPKCRKLRPSAAWIFRV